MKLVGLLKKECGTYVVSEWLRRQDKGITVILGFEEGMPVSATSGLKLFLLNVWNEKKKKMMDELRSRRICDIPSG
jgi:hypothetical protein